MKYRQKPVVIEAFQMTRERRGDSREWPQWLDEAWNRHPADTGAVWPCEYPNSDGTDELNINTLKGVYHVTFGDWIIQGVRGDLYPCTPDIFAATYEAVP